MAIKSNQIKYRIKKNSRYTLINFELVSREKYNYNYEEEEEKESQLKWLLIINIYLNYG